MGPWGSMDPWAHGVHVPRVGCEREARPGGLGAQQTKALVPVKKKSGKGSGKGGRDAILALKDGGSGDGDGGAGARAC